MLSGGWVCLVISKQEEGLVCSQSVYYTDHEGLPLRD